MDGTDGYQTFDSRSQQAFAAALCRTLRESRRRQKLTQAEVAARTNGLVSKVALANYETGHRSLRVDVLWIIAGALGEDVRELVRAAERTVGTRPTGFGTESVTVDAAALLASTDSRLAVAKRWFELRHQLDGQVTLDSGAIAALAALMNVRPDEARRLFLSFGTGTRSPRPTEPPVRRPGAPMADDGSVVVRVAAVLASDDASTALLRCWLGLREGRRQSTVVSLSPRTIEGLAFLMETTTAEVKTALHSFTDAPASAAAPAG